MISVQNPKKRLMLGYAASIGSAACYGSVALVGRKIVGEYAPPLVATAFSMSLGMAMVAVLFFNDVRSDLRRGLSQAWIMLALAGLASAWGVSFWFLALGEAPVVLVAPLVGVSPLVSIALTHFFLQRLEKVTIRTVMGAIMVVGGVALVTLGNQ
ncbi:MAG: DMT family transporter [SAR202 cluster bacterium]|jgi:drug/metabolite transporter (DMT)-like permease|nr:DMT family transporter [SAR202 cluster bacterium]MDP6514403.1 DMT family transporter [SAR202 cluster bacterium]